MLVLVVLLVVVGVLALATVPLMIRSTRRQHVEPGQAVGRQPLMGSPAQVWTSRGERVLRELNATLTERPAFGMVAGAPVADHGGRRGGGHAGGHRPGTFARGGDGTARRGGPAAGVP